MTLTDDLAAAKALLAKAAAKRQQLPPHFTEQQREDFLKMSGGLIAGADTYRAYQLLASFVAELERLRAEGSTR